MGAMYDDLACHVWAPILRAKNGPIDFFARKVEIPCEIEFPCDSYGQEASYKKNRILFGPLCAPLARF